MTGVRCQATKGRDRNGNGWQYTDNGLRAFLQCSALIGSLSLKCSALIGSLNAALLLVAASPEERSYWSTQYLFVSKSRDGATWRCHVTWLKPSGSERYYSSLISAYMGDSHKKCHKKRDFETLSWSEKTYTKINRVCSSTYLWDAVRFVALN